MRGVHILLLALAIIPEFIESSSLRKVKNPLDRQADHPPAIQAGQSASTLPKLPLVMRITAFTFPQNIGLLTKGSGRSYQQILKGNIPVLAVGDYAVGRMQTYNGVVLGLFNQYHKRVKVNMKTKRIELMSENEQREFTVGKALEMPGTLVLRGRNKDSYDWDPNFFQKELQNNPNFIHPMNYNHDKPLHLNPNLAHNVPQTLAQTHDVMPEISHGLPHNPAHPHDWNSHIVQSVPHGTEDYLQYLNPHLFHSPPHSPDHPVE